ncbi:MAG: cation:dicarboxylase symporter family transporter, partial [Erysipelotrichaceae bacterium]|nr:cation:dicarboxylase symporter family transporter [Erysipelotrichaceae bacterium]
LEIPKKLYSFWIPLAHALFAVSNIVPLFASVFFTAYTNHLEVTFSKLILIVLLLIELAIASPKVPGGILATYSLLFAEIGLPDNVLGLLMASNVFLVNFEVAAGMLLKFSDLEDLHLRMQKEKAANH